MISPIERGGDVVGIGSSGERIEQSPSRLQVEMDLLPPGQDIVPRVSQDQIPNLIQATYSLTVKSIKQLDGYDDKNYHIQVCPETHNPYISEVWEHGYVLKIMNSLDSKNTDFVRGQHEFMYHLEKRGINVPLPVKNVSGETLSFEKFESDEDHIVRLLTYQPGNVLGNTEPTADILYNVGKFVGKLTNCLKDFYHPAYENRKSIWMLECVLSIREFLYVIEDSNKLQIVTDVLQQFEDNVLPNLRNIERGVIHGDVNEQNIIIEDGEVKALLDFGDSHYSARVFELAICMCYLFIHSKDIDGGRHIIRGYLQTRQLSSIEKQILKVSICGRLCQSLVLGLYSYSRSPGNDYILGTQKHGWRILQALHELKNEDIFEFWELNEM